MLQPIEWINILQKERDVEFSCIKWEIPILITLLVPAFTGIVVAIVDLRFGVSVVCFPLLWLGIAILICLAAAAYPILLYLETVKKIKSYNELIQLILSEENIAHSKICKEYKKKFLPTKLTSEKTK